MRELALRLLTDPEYVRRLAQRLIMGKAPHMEVLLAHYAWGKPKEHVQLDVNDVTRLELVLVEARQNGSGNGHSGPAPGNGNGGPVIDITPEKPE